MAGWWSRLFGRRGAPAPPSRALPAVTSEPPSPGPDPNPEPTVEVAEQPDELADARDISPARLDQALARLREEIPAPESSPAPEEDPTA